MDRQHEVQGFPNPHESKASNPIHPAAIDRPMYTFIDHDDDLSSKRIRDANARKAIRSHVMRDVRRRERLAGLKRITKRESRLKHPLPLSASISTQAESSTSECLLEAGVASPLPASSSFVDSNPPRSLLRSPQERRRPLVWRAGYSVPPTPAPNPLAFPSSWLLDPFGSLMGAGEAPSRVARLVCYWKSVFVPMTFPEEHKINEQAETGLMVKSSFSDPGSFFGLMAMCAAHRAVLAGYHIDCSRAPDSSRSTGHDTDYYFMKARCMQEMNAKMCDSERALSDESFDTMVNLLTSTLIIGMFDETRIHLAGLKRMVELRGGLMADSIRQPSMLAAIITSDVKAASGLMTKPLFLLPWDPRPVPSSVQQRIRPPAASVLARLGAAFFDNNIFSLPLLRILDVMRDIVLYSQAYRERPASLCPEDHELFRVVNCETEHRLLSYIYTDGHQGSPSETQLDISPIEAVTRVACICFLNQFLILSPPSSGLGRALTKHLKASMSSWSLSLGPKSTKAINGLLAWVLFIGAQSSAGQAEHSWFIGRLARLAMLRGWQKWEQVADTLANYFYLPDFHGAIWESAWKEAVTGLVSQRCIGECSNSSLRD
ncbi:hypothetical protein KXX33_003696 [Aspergillus fumigatus]|nr:hypothetical protein KXX45_003198 [Aspergillus fumigatus]KAH1275300.1 hypothetical protein KXX30_004878 [Aspergillus fumigatus]KAH1276719.1 hypothetical protein KXX48_005362 [Aspergillus fumigatus]KAH1310325.1 hypothetical protein KXX66_009179 [Aspergillus fumigatus]KAH1343637.1 hypothetical protein KXX33_003696 [Aspergillus fumigatus]